MADRSPGLFDVETRLADISAKGDGPERVAALVDFELFRPTLEAAVPRRDRARGGRPPFDHVLMLKVPILRAMHSLSDERTEFLIRDRLSFMRFLGLGLADPVPDANTIWTYREALKKAGAFRTAWSRTRRVSPGRTGMRAGRSNTQKPSRRRMDRFPMSTSLSLLRLQESYRRGPGLRADPQVDGDRRRSARRCSS